MAAVASTDGPAASTQAMEDALENVRVELHQRIAVHEQETVTLKENAATAELKNEALMIEIQKLLKELQALKDQVK